MTKYKEILIRTLNYPSKPAHIPADSFLRCATLLH